MKIKSEHIIIVIVAFLIGVAATSYIMHGKNDGTKIITEETTMEEGEETTNQEGETSEEVMEEDAEIPAGIAVPPSPTPPATTVTSTKPSTQFVSGKCSTGLSARKDEKLNAIVLNWSPCASDDFQFYKLVKSSKNTNPGYPADPVAYSSSNKNAANFVDKTVAARTTYYYKLCVVQRLGQVNCSGVASASF